MTNKEKNETLEIPYGWPRFKFYKKLQAVAQPFKGRDYPEILENISLLDSSKQSIPEFREATTSESISIMSYSAMMGTESPIFEKLREAILGYREPSSIIAGRAVKTSRGIYFNPIKNGRYISDEKILDNLRQEHKGFAFVPYHNLPWSEFSYGGREDKYEESPAQAEEFRNYEALEEFVSTPLARAIENSGSDKAYGLQMLVLALLESPQVYLRNFEKVQRRDGKTVPIITPQEGVLRIGGGYYNGTILLSFEDLPLHWPGAVYAIKNNHEPYFGRKLNYD